MGWFKDFFSCEEEQTEVQTEVGFWKWYDLSSVKPKIEEIVSKGSVGENVRKIIELAKQNNVYSATFKREFDEVVDLSYKTAGTESKRIARRRSIRAKQ